MNVNTEYVILFWGRVRLEKCRTKAIAELLGFALGTSFFSLAFLGKGKASGQQVYPASTRSKGVEEGGGITRRYLRLRASSPRVVSGCISLSWNCSLENGSSQTGASRKAKWTPKVSGWHVPRIEGGDLFSFYWNKSHIGEAKQLNAG